MNKIILCIVLGLIPVISYILQYYFSRKAGIIKLLKQNYMVYYSDWIFIAFNGLWIYTVDDNKNITFLVAAVLISLGLNYLVHKYYAINTLMNDKNHLFRTNGKIRVTGVIHFIFSSIETMMIIIFLFSPIKNIYTSIEIGILTIFVLSFIPSSLKMHEGKILDSDLATVIIGMAAIVMKIIF